MPLLTTAEFIQKLHDQDPNGTRLISFRIYDEDDQDALMAHGEIDKVGLVLKSGQQTDEGDRDTLRVDLFLDCYT